MPPSFGSYELEAQIGRGSMGRVYKARHKQTGILRAIKVLDGNVDAEGLARFRRETAALARLGGEGVVAIHDAGAEGGRLFYVMDFMPGGTLHEKLRPGMPMPWKEAATIVAKLARGLARCHENGFVHRDVKPANVLFDDQGNPFLADFGLCRDLFADKLTVTGSVVGTPAYMAPEQLQGKKADGRADVFGLGVVLYELCAGARPYQGMSWNELLEGALKNERGSMQQLVGAPRELDDILARALQPDPSKRFESAGSLAKELENLLKPRPAAPPPPRISGRSGSLQALPATPKAKAPERNVPVLVRILVLAAAFALGAGGVLLAFRPGGARSETGLSLDEPREGASLAEGETCHVLGTAAQAKQVTVNGSPATLHPDGAFAAALVFDARSPEVVVVATLADGSHVEARRKLARKKGGTPDWWLALPEAERPALPLRRGLRFGDKPGEYVNEKDGSVLVFVPAGTSRMGSDETFQEESKPAHDVTLSAYFIGREELTNERYMAFVQATGYQTNAEARGSGEVFDVEFHWKPVQGACWRNPQGDGNTPPPTHPVVQVSWNDALAYVLWAGLELPTEAQWEKAAGWEPKAGRAHLFSWGDKLPGPGTPLYANLPDESLKELWPSRPILEGYKDGFVRTAPVGSFPAGASSYGALDMTGNVSEWVDDSYDPGYYKTSPRVNPHRSPNEGAVRCGRGGSWGSEPQGLHVTTRFPAMANWGSDIRGFRVAASSEAR